MDDGAEIDTADPREQIARLEERIEQLAAKIESCRKFALASRLAIALGMLVLLVLLLGAIRFDSVVMSASIAAVLAGIVGLGTNRSTASEAAAQLAVAEAHRSELIGRIELRLVGDQDVAR